MLAQLFQLLHDDPLLLMFLAGGIGSLTKDIVVDNKLTIPRVINGELSLGFLGGMLSGAVVGYLVDNNTTTAFFAGYAGTQIIDQLAQKKTQHSTSQPESVEQTIRRVASANGVDPDLAVRVARCESRLDPSATNTNTDGSIDRGVFQWNNKFHPEVSEAMARDVEIATKLFCDAVKSDHISWWNATRKCWER